MAIVNGQEVKVGECVGFKADIEQYGEIYKIRGNTLYLKATSEEGFEGDYISGPLVLIADDVRNCW